MCEYIAAGGGTRLWLSLPLSFWLGRSLGGAPALACCKPAEQRSVNGSVVFCAGMWADIESHRVAAVAFVSGLHRRHTSTVAPVSQGADTIAASWFALSAVQQVCFVCCAFSVVELWVVKRH